MASGLAVVVEAREAGITLWRIKGVDTPLHYVR
jgi:hypothetical protein